MPWASAQRLRGPLSHCHGLRCEFHAWCRRAPTETRTQHPATRWRFIGDAMPAQGQQRDARTHRAHADASNDCHALPILELGAANLMYSYLASAGRDVSILAASRRGFLATIPQTVRRHTVLSLWHNFWWQGLPAKHLSQSFPAGGGSKPRARFMRARLRAQPQSRREPRATIANYGWEQRHAAILHPCGRGNSAISDA